MSVTRDTLAALGVFFVAVLLLGDRGAMAQQYPDDQNPNQPDQNYPNQNPPNYGYNNGNNGVEYGYDDYGGGEPIDYGGGGVGGASPPISYIQCFACVYQVRAGHKSGMENCNDPFVVTDIPSVDCKGPCGKMYHQLSEGDYSVSRACIPNCKEHRDANSYTQCCSLSQCNTATSYHVPRGHTLLLSLITVSALSLWLTR